MANINDFEQIVQRWMAWKDPPQKGREHNRTVVECVNDLLFMYEKTKKLTNSRRDMFTAAALQGICSTPLAAEATTDPAGPSKLGILAMMIADATIAMLDKVDPPKRIGEVSCDEQ